MPRISGDRHRLFPLPSTPLGGLRYSAVNYVSTLAYQAPQFVLPVIVLLTVDPDRNAAFYVAWGITSIAFYVPMAIGQALLAEGGKDGSASCAARCASPCWAPPRSWPSLRSPRPSAATW